MNSIQTGGWNIVYFGVENQFAFADLAPSTEYAKIHHL